MHVELRKLHAYDLSAMTNKMRSSNQNTRSFLQGIVQGQKTMPMALCQIVAHEVQLENIRRRDKASTRYALWLCVTTSICAISKLLSLAYVASGL